MWIRKQQQSKLQYIALIWSISECIGVSGRQKSSSNVGITSFSYPAQKCNKLDFVGEQNKDKEVVLILPNECFVALFHSNSKFELQSRRQKSENP